MDDNNTNKEWLSRRELAHRPGLPVKTLAQWASKGTGPPYAWMSRRVRYRHSDLIEWETEGIDDLPEAAQTVAPTDRAYERLTRPASHDRNSASIGNVR